MPELPEILVYIEALERRVLNQRLIKVRIKGPSLLRTYDPPLEALEGKTVQRLARLGKRIAFGLEDELWVILHLMIAGRLHWKPPGTLLATKHSLAALDFEQGTLLLTEAGTKHRAAMYVVRGGAALSQHEPGGLDVLNATLEQFEAALCGRNQTVKRALTDPHVMSGIGNAYSDEILHRARLSPFVLTQKMTVDEIKRLFAATKGILQEWIHRLRAEAGDEFPERVTAFRPEMAVHGRYRQPCPVCGAPVQRIRYTENELNYCPGCQTEGRILSDRSLARLLKDAWPKHLDEL